jgi:hypothetical protein
MFRLAVFAAALAVAPAAAFAGEGVCNLDASHIKRTYGFSAHGISDGNNPFAPAGDFVQSGTETNNPTTVTRSTISGTWNVVLDQNDTSGVKLFSSCLPRRNFRSPAHPSWAIFVALAAKKRDNPLVGIRILRMSIQAGLHQLGRDLGSVIFEI